MKKKHIILLIAGLLILGAAGAYFYFGRAEKKNSYSLVTEKVKRSSIANIVTSTGTIQPVDTVAVGTQISGIIKHIYTDYNAIVKVGQLLAELDPTLMQATVDQIKGNLALARSNLDYQKINFGRQKQLYDVGSISRAAYDLAENSLRNAEAVITSTRAQLNAAQKNLSFTRIYSPINGVVLNRNINVGQTVAASFNTPTLFSLAKDITKMQAQAKVDEADIGKVKPGERVTFTVDAHINDVFNGTVSEIRLQPTIAANVVTYTTIIQTNNDQLKLKPGMTATITIFTEEAENVLTVPLPALKFKPDSALLEKKYSIIPFSGKRARTDYFVWVLDNLLIREKKIITGISDNTRIEVVSGLNENDNILTGIVSGSGVTVQDTERSPFLPTMRRR
ncbi:efflux RND transporter periplasmic adaptor subunit [Flavihumibacter stibioxidans]|uniref:Efflux transporter periplasmic adaptor subunit n=1 Tax=Flavihumibacter stibioxidans TaxID=1834163 RepID=A0ABR7M697_9BACT|nr:efflux RND transporter periplasmic adaptor subunit [Flavihumibacter stibioxidans]MBC6490542.1 efflux transporter periplasmic adaptor subunit [Flavihumibacter stibioxidans]